MAESAQNLLGNEEILSRVFGYRAAPGCVALRQTAVDARVEACSACICIVGAATPCSSPPRGTATTTTSCSTTVRAHIAATAHPSPPVRTLGRHLWSAS